MKKLLFTLIFATFSIIMLAQSFCFTPSPSFSGYDYQEAKKVKSNLKNSSNIFYLFKIYFHVIRDINGNNGVSVQDVQTAYNVLESDFNMHNIYFLWDGNIDYINTDSYLIPSNSIFSQNKHSDGIDIYIYPFNAPTLGYANGFGGGTELFVSGKYQSSLNWKLLATSHVISHEMGHIFNLYHTHHGTYHEGGDSNECAELVDGSNSGECGDYVEDTPADPNLDGKVMPGVCTILPNVNLKDANGQYYQPDCSLIMSYTLPDCMQTFSPKQVERMKMAISGFDILRKAMPKLSGSQYVCDTGYYTIDIPNGATVQWSVSNNLLSVQSQQNNSITLARTGPQIGTCTLTATILYNGMQSLPISMLIYVGTPQLGMSIEFRTPQGQLGYWSSSESGNTFTIEDYQAGFYNRIEGELYRIDNNFNLSTLVDSWYNINLSNFSIDGRTQGWYLFRLRGINDCGCSSWLAQEVEMLDPYIGGLLLSYNKSSGILTLTVNESASHISSSTMSAIQASNHSTYEIQIWSNLSLLKRYTSEELTYQVSVNDLPTGVYVVQVIIGGKTYSRKFVKR